MDRHICLYFKWQEDKKQKFNNQEKKLIKDSCKLELCSYKECKFIRSSINSNERS